jgi:hypothetical protein
MRIAIGVRVSGVWVALAATALLAACKSGGDAGTDHMATPSRAAQPSAAQPSAAPTPPAPSAVTNATISWSPPTENTNGTSVGAIGGYRIYYGTASHEYTTTIDVSNPGLTTYVVDALNVGVTYYFAVTALSAAGVESAPSPEVAATIS